MNSIPLLCYNCGELNHTSKMCTNPIYSYGIIAIKVNTFDTYYKLLQCINKSIIEIENLTSNAELLMIQRNYSYCFLWFIKGIEVENQNFEYLKPIWEKITEKEQLMIKNMKPEGFKNLWKSIWKTKSNKIYKKNEYDKAYNLFHVFFQNKYLKERLFQIPSICKELEWGFPKGRRLRNKKYLKQESNLECAKREFHEETNYSEEDYIILNNNETYKEFFYGSDGIQYAHEYYIALILWENTTIPKITYNNYEVNNIKWLTDLENIYIYQSSRNKIIQSLWKLKKFFKMNVI